MTSGRGVPLARVPRLVQVDALRGFALLGICMVNAPVLAGAWTLAPGAAAPWDRTAAWLVTALFTTKFYLLFAFLFGYSFVLQEAAAARDEVSFARRHARRLLGLFLLGLAHAVLLYPGDILMTYAVLGLLLYALRGLDTRALLWTAGALVVLLTAVFLVVGVAALGLGDVGQVSDRALEARQSAWYRGGPRMVVHANLAAYRQAFTGALLYGPHLLAAMLTGLAAGRRGWLDPARLPTASSARGRRLLAAGLLIGLPGGVLTAMCGHGPFDARYYYLGQAVDILTAPVLSAAYATVLVSLLRGRSGPGIAAVLAAAGRMSLSHYLLQSGVLAFVFTGYGLARYGTVGPAALACGCVALWATQLVLSAVHMGRVRYGPAEALLRRVTGGRPPAARPARRRAGV
ncbi:DUF418 domain-containing protein [Streptomyces sp. NBC_00103]|uniref:DUF418 domain-containing protein n=1 Tax=Streptomyces sp. NBC_00103 TaxID=2975653 RepID=UPI00224E9F2D|nr:DUF418 domain-containing protein [Streptomyces sp. NBC_00103]MCX5372125.1 DUF418 domain-containing protein [Streptomyces sp. NBC_00103]